MVDIELMEVEALLSVSHYKVCHEKNGWLVPGTMDKVRKLIDEKANDAVIQRFGTLLSILLKLSISTTFFVSRPVCARGGRGSRGKRRLISRPRLSTCYSIS